MIFTFTSPCRAGCLIEGDSLQSLVYAPPSRAVMDDVSHTASGRRRGADSRSAAFASATDRRFFALPGEPALQPTALVSRALPRCRSALDRLAVSSSFWRAVRCAILVADSGAFRWTSAGRAARRSVAVLTRAPGHHHAPCQHPVRYFGCRGQRSTEAGATAGRQSTRRCDWIPTLDGHPRDTERRHDGDGRAQHRHRSQPEDHPGRL